MYMKESWLTKLNCNPNVFANTIQVYEIIIFTFKKQSYGVVMITRKTNLTSIIKSNRENGLGFYIKMSNTDVA